jgi:dienelactone hydrolase
MTRWTQVFAALAVVLMAPVLAWGQERISIPSETPTLLLAYLHGPAAKVTVTGDLYLPANATGPVPALILKHSSGGLAGADGDNVRAWAKTLTDWGVAAFVIDSFGPRGVTSTAADPAQLSQWSDLADAFNGLKVLAADPRIDKSRIGVMGWSRGGTIAMISALESARLAILAPSDPKFAAHIVFYGSASTQFRDKATDGAPMLFLHGEADDYVPVGPVKEFAAWLKGMGNPVTFITYPGAYHEFDVEGTFGGLARRVQSGRACDAVIDFTDAQVLRMDHKPVSGITPADFAAYYKSCGQQGADLYYNAQARADAVNQVHAFLRQVFHIPG